MKLKANTAFLVALLVSILLAGVFGYEANQFRQSLNDAIELPSEFDSTSQGVEAYLHRRVADASARASYMAALEAAIDRQDSERIAELQERLISEFGETAESTRELTLKRATQDLEHAEQLLRTFNEKNLILSRYTGVSLGSLAVALTLIAWWVSRSIKGFGFKIVLAAISGFLAWFYFLFYLSSGVGFSEVIAYGLPGMFFAIGVMFPYLDQAAFTWLRRLGLIVLCAISFWSAIKVALQLATWEIGPQFGILAYVSASLVGTVIVLTGARLIIPLSRTLALTLSGLVAAIVGGLVCSLAEPLDFGWIAFPIWHSLMAAAIHVAENWPFRVGKSE